MSNRIFAPFHKLIIHLVIFEIREDRTMLVVPSY